VEQRVRLSPRPPQPDHCSGEFASVSELVDRIMAFIVDYNHTARPFRWTYDGRPLQAT
jgi:hypothetical protein